MEKQIRQKENFYSPCANPLSISAHKLIVANFLFFFSLILLFPSFLYPETLGPVDEPFAYPSNWGGTGLMEIPTARVMRENSYRIGFSQVKPYRYYYGAISPMKGLEIDGRITEVLGVQGLADPAYGNYKDKAVGLKYQVIPEGKYMPALAIGIMDPHGTRIYPSQYIVASKQIYPFDFTLGLGNGRFGTKPLIARTEDIKIELISDTMDWLKESQFFWGIQFAPSEKYALMLEYSPIRYDQQTIDPAQPKYFRDPVPSRFNYGIRIRPVDWAEVDLSYQRGNRIGVNVSTAFDIGKPLVPIYDHIYRESPSDRLNPLQLRLAKSLHNSGFSNIGIDIINRELWIAAENDNYFFNARAIGVILKILADAGLEGTDKIHIVLTENAVPTIEFITTREDIIDLHADKMTLNEFASVSEVRPDTTGMPDIPIQYGKPFGYGMKPEFQSYLNSREGFFKYRLGLSVWGNYHPWQGGSCIAGLEWYPLNTVPVENLDDSSIPVRSDVALYKSRQIALGRLMFEQIYKTGHNIYSKASAGLLEVEYAGVDAEIAMPVLNGRVLLGLSGSAVKKRDADKPFTLVKDDVKDIYTTAFFNTRFNIPEYELFLDVKAGRFLAGDNGIRFTVSKFINGVKLWAWYSITDTSIFTDQFNKGYHDKGIGFSVPIRLFSGSDTRTSYPYAIASWTRDTGQDIDHFSTLFDFIGRNTKIYLDKDRQKLY